MRAPTIALAVAITAVTGCSRASDDEAIERIVQIEKERGNIAGFQIIPWHLTVEATIAPSTARATPETELAFARQWGQSFCEEASRKVNWQKTWNLIVYAYGRETQSYSCRFPDKS
jgi:hypothetical protein